MPILILWGHALAALAFAALAIVAIRRTQPLAPRGPLVLALGATALWALAVAGIGEAEPVPRLFESVRDLAWLGLMLTLVRRAGAGQIAVYAVYAMGAGIALLTGLLAQVDALPLTAEAAGAVAGAHGIARMLTALVGLILIHHLAIADHGRQQGRMQVFAAAVAVMWGTEFVVAVAGWGVGAALAGTQAMRGIAMIGVAWLLAFAWRGGTRGLAVSHGAALRVAAILAILGYAGVTVLATEIAGQLAGEGARVVQTAIVLGAATALMTLVSTPWLRAWAKVKVAKHFFRHRYDYRAEWQRFTGTLGLPGEGVDPLDRRIIRALADLTGSPAGLLLVPEGSGLGVGAGWDWPEGGPCDAALVDYLGRSERIVGLDEVRAGTAPVAETAAIPDWMRDAADAWVLVPLIHGTSLIGAILLARPAADRPLDWEDLDLLRVAGRQAASYLAEDRAHAALADAARFDEFNRRFAFILHDIKNLVSGLSLVARNAERHADNPEFRADMVETLKDSASRMNALLARLSQHHRTLPEPTQPVDVAALAARLAAGRRAQHTVEVSGTGVALAQPGRLEQLLGHLLQNAIEASPAGTPIRLHVAAADGQVAIEVVDRGCGMSAAFVRDQLFRPFASSKPDGFGIGAYEARQLAIAMGGVLAVDSREGEGTRFRLTLPVARECTDALERAA